MKEFMQLICAFLGSVGFALVFNTKLKKLPFAGIGGLVCWGIYLLLLHFTKNLFLAVFTSAAFCSLYGEILARLLKAPTTVFMISSVIPLIPGSSLFYTMQYAVLNDWEMCKHFAFETVIFVGAITLGLSIVSAIFKIFTKTKN